MVESTIRWDFKISPDCFLIGFLSGQPTFIDQLLNKYKFTQDHWVLA